MYSFLMCLCMSNTFTGLGQCVIYSPFPGCDFISKKLHEFVFFIDKTPDPGTGFLAPPVWTQWGMINEKKAIRGSHWYIVGPQ